jgi:hypothetical protein
VSGLTKAEESLRTNPYFKSAAVQQYHTALQNFLLATRRNIWNALDGQRQRLAPSMSQMQAAIAHTSSTKFATTPSTPPNLVTATSATHTLAIGSPTPAATKRDARKQVKFSNSEDSDAEDPDAEDPDSEDDMDGGKPAINSILKQTSALKDKSIAKRCASPRPTTRRRSSSHRDLRSDDYSSSDSPSDFDYDCFSDTYRRCSRYEYRNKAKPYFEFSFGFRFGI